MMISPNNKPVGLFPDMKPQVLASYNGKLAQTKERKTRQRTLFTSHQLKEMEKSFRCAPYPTHVNRGELSKNLDLDESRVQIWFQNRRAKWRKGISSKHNIDETKVDVTKSSTADSAPESTNNASSTSWQHEMQRQDHYNSSCSRWLAQAPVYIPPQWLGQTIIPQNYARSYWDSDFKNLSYADLQPYTATCS